MEFLDLFSDSDLEAVHYGQFALNAILAAILSFVLSVFYKKFGNAATNRSHFSNNFVLLALSTMLIIYIVKSSIALSLGLVGALSIVRFRAAIKEPEELTYLLLVIAIGLGMGANQSIITLLAFVLILSLLYTQRFLKKERRSNLNNQMVVNISSKKLDEIEINNVITTHFKVSELRRMSHNNGQIYLSYVVTTADFNQLSETKQTLLAKEKDLEFSIIDNKNSFQ